MSLETKIDELIGALNANTEAHGGKPGKAATPGKPAAGKPGKAADTPTFETVKAAVLGVRDAFTKPVALALIKKHAKALEIASVKPAYYQAVLDACAEKMAEVGGEGDEGEGVEDDEL